MATRIWEKVSEVLGFSGVNRPTRSTRSRRSRVNRLVMDCNRCTTELCRIAKRHGTDKSPLRRGGGHAYTPVYDLLFGPSRERPLVLAEIGILNAAGLKTFREYFPKAKLYGFEYDDGHIKDARLLELHDTWIDFIDVGDSEAIDRAFQKTNELFDIIIDDSSHNQDDQLRIIECCAKFLRPGGTLIIEDIFNDERAPERYFEATLKRLRHEYRSATFVLPQHRRNPIDEWNNHKLLVLVKQ